MRKEIRLDFLGEGVDSVVLVKWHKKAQDAIKEGETVCEVETYKAVFQVEAEDKGVLVEAKYAEGDVIDIPAVLGYIESHE